MERNCQPLFFFFQAEDGIRDDLVTEVQTCALPIFGIGFCHCDCWRNDFAGRDEGNIYNDKIYGFRKVFRTQFARVALDRSHERILTQLPVKLFHVHVYGIDPGRAMLEQAIRETTVRSADIQANAPARVDGRVLQSAFHLYATAADELLRAADDFDARAFLNGHACLFCPPAIYLNFSRENHGHRFLRRISEASLDEKKIEPPAACLLFHNSSNDQARRRTRNSAISRRRAARSENGASSAMAFVARSLAIW